MDLKRITVRNFLSYGNHPETLEFNKGLFRVSGKNGHGKSTILTDAIMFALYGKTIKKLSQTQIVNSLNKSDCLVELEFTKGDETWKVTRGLKPKKFEITKDGKPCDDLSSVQLQQQWFEENVIQITPEMMKQFVILAGRNYTPFFEMTAQQKRQFLEDVLGLAVIGKYDKVARGEIRNKTNELNRLLGKHDEIMSSIETLEKLYEQASEQADEKVKRYISDLEKVEKAIDGLKTQKDSIDVDDSKVYEIESEMEMVRGRLESVKQQINEMAMKYKNLSGEIEQIDSVIEHKDACPTCGQELQPETLENLLETKEKLKKEMDTIKGCLVELKETYDNMEMYYKKLSSKHNVEKEMLEHAKRRVDEIERKLIVVEQKKASLLEMIDQAKMESGATEIKEQIAQKETEKKQVEEVIGTLESEIKALKNLREVFSDDGVKSTIVARNIMFIEERLNHWLCELGLFAVVEFDENLDETIKMQGYEEQSYSACSMGEKTRLSLASLFAFRDLVEAQGRKLPSLIVLDEVIENLDQDGKRMLLDNLYKVAYDSDMGIYLISHDTGLDARFDGCYTVEKDEGFSVIKEGC